MSEWWTYSLTDFLLFSPETYARLFLRYNEAVWPAQLPVLAAGLLVLILGWRRHPLFPRAALTLLAFGWAWTGWAFHLQRYASINWAAVWFGAAFFVQAALLARTALLTRASADGRRGVAFGLGMTLLAVALLYPLLALLTSRPLAYGEIVGLAPDPTVLATLGILLMTVPRLRGLLLVLPLAWCAISGATLWAMDAPQAFILPIAGLLTLLLLRRR